MTTGKTNGEIIELGASERQRGVRKAMVPAAVMIVGVSFSLYLNVLWLFDGKRDVFYWSMLAYAPLYLFVLYVLTYGWWTRRVRYEYRDGDLVRHTPLGITERVQVGRVRCVRENAGSGQRRIAVEDSSNSGCNVRFLLRRYGDNSHTLGVISDLHAVSADGAFDEAVESAVAAYREGAKRVRDSASPEYSRGEHRVYRSLAAGRFWAARDALERLEGRDDRLAELLVKLTRLIELADSC